MANPLKSCRALKRSNTIVGTFLREHLIMYAIVLVLSFTITQEAGAIIIRDDRDDASSRLVSIIGGRGNHIDSALLEMAAHAP